MAETLTYTLVVSGPPDVLQAAVAAYARAYGWTATIPGPDGQAVPNPVPPEQYAREPILAYLRETAEGQLVREAAIAAAEATRTNLADKTPTIDLTVE